VLSFLELSINWWSLKIATGPLTLLQRSLHALFSDFVLMNGSGGKNLGIGFTNCISDVFLLLILVTLHNVTVHSI